MEKLEREKFFTGAERRLLLSSCQEMSTLDVIKGRTTWPTRFMLVDLALRSGLRVGEIAALKLKHIHLNKADNYLAIRDGAKGGKHRDVYIDSALAQHIKQYLKWKRQTLRLSTEPEDYLLSKTDNTAFTTTALHISFKKALEKARIKRVLSIHNARHDYATRCLADTGDLRFTQKQLGHSSIQFTAIYADILPEKNNLLAEAINI